MFKLKLNFLLFFLPLLLFASSCNTTEPRLEPNLALELKDVSCTEAWLQLTTNNIQLPATINVLKNNSVSQVFNLNTKDSSLYIDSLLPNQTYKFKIVQNTTNNPQPTTNEVLVQTMDTTSHNFTWQTFEFGQHSSSVLYDVTIIDENNIWAVGEIYMNDSLGQPDPLPYNGVHWDGNKWELKRITVNFRGFIITPPLDGAFSFSETDIWFVGSLPIHGDGENWIMYDLRTTLDPNLSFLKAWGSSSNNMYFVGRNGSIAQFNGSQWIKLEIGITDNVGNIWGISDGNGGYNKYLSTGEAMLILDKKNRTTMIKAEQNDYVNQIWGIFNRLIYTAGNGIVLYKNNRWGKINNAELNTIYGIKGNNHNNVFGISSTSSIFHFNGYNWQNNNMGNNNIYYRLDVNNNLAGAVGWQGDRAIIILLRRN